MLLLLLLLGRIAASDCGLLLHMESRGRSVCLCVCLFGVCLLVTFLSPAKTAEPIEMTFGDSVGTMNSMGVLMPQE